MLRLGITLVTVAIVFFVIEFLSQLYKAKKAKKENEVLFKRFIPHEYEGDGTSRMNVVPGTGCFSNFAFKGFFEGWGSEVEETESNIGTYSVGIIRDYAGNVHTVHPTHIKFINK